MADDVAVTPGAGASIATDEVAGRHFQRVKVAHGADGSAVDVSAAAPLPVEAVGKVEGTLLASASRTATVTTADVTSPAARGVALLLNVTARTAPVTLGLRILGRYGPPGVSGAYLHNIAEIPAVVDGLGRFGYLIHPDVATVDPASLAANYTAYRLGAPLPLRWFCEVWHSTADPATYSLTYCTLP